MDINSKYIDSLLKRQNSFSSSDCRDLFTRTDYYNILNSNEISEENIIEIINYLVNKKKLTTGISVVSGTVGRSFNYNCGFTCDKKIQAVNNNTILDIASVTKLFLSLCYFILHDNNLVDFNKPIKYYSNKFKNLRDLSLYNLMHFTPVIVTKKRLTECDYEEAIFQLRNIEIKDNQSVYSDMPAIILGLLFYDIAKIDFGTFIDKKIIKHLNLKNTFWGNKEQNHQNVMNYDNEYTFINGNLNCYKNSLFEVNDKKAQILSNNGKYLSGHAGLFSCSNDIKTICEALISEKILSKKALFTIGDISNQPLTSKRFGYLTYVKNPVIENSEISHAMSGNAFAISGFTGTYLLIDPQNNYFCFIGGNRLNNRLTYCDDNDFLNKTNIIYSRNYVYEKDLLRDNLFYYFLKGR